MALLRQAEEFYEWMITNGDPRTDDWFLVKTPIPVFIIMFSYIAVVTIVPALMKNQQALKLKWIIIPYNFGCIFLSAYTFYEFVVTSILSGYSYICQPVDYSQSPLALRMANAIWWFYISKIIELSDTVFIILRKKNEQISFLHVYHHSTVVFTWWMGIKYVPGGQSFLIAMVNSFIHVIMYTYYGFAAIGPHMQKYLWWKKYLTTLQLIQFALFLVHASTNYFVECTFPKGFDIYIFIYVNSLIILFANFYYRSYIAKKDKDLKKN